MLHLKLYLVLFWRCRLRKVSRIRRLPGTLLVVGEKYSGLRATWILRNGKLIERVSYQGRKHTYKVAS